MDLPSPGSNNADPKQVSRDRERTVNSPSAAPVASSPRQPSTQQPSPQHTTTQRAELKIVLAGAWPPLKPLPIFKYEASEYRAAIDFDKLRGEWVCRKTSFPSNSIQEARGGLRDLVMAVTDTAADCGAGDFAGDARERELPRDAARRAQAMLQWQTQCENGVRYSALRAYLLKNQHEEICEILRLSLTARQLQFTVKNVAYVFDALAKAGGRLATLVALAERNQTQASINTVGSAAGACGEDPTEVIVAESAVEAAEATGESVATWTPVTNEAFRDPTTPSTFGQEKESWSEEPRAQVSAQAFEFIDAMIPEGQARPARESFRESIRRLPRVDDIGDRGKLGVLGDFASQSPADTFESTISGRKGSSGRVLELSGFQLAAVAAVILFAVIAFTAGLKVGRGLLEGTDRATRKATVAVDTAPAPLPSLAGESAPRVTEQSSVQSSGQASVRSSAQVEASAPVNSSFETPAASSPWPEIAEPSSASAAKDPTKNMGKSEALAKTATEVSTSISPNDVAPKSASPRTVSPAAVPPGGLAKAMEAPEKAAPRNSFASRRGIPVGRFAPHQGFAPRRGSSATVLVSGPGNGSKAFRLTLPEKPIAASASFAMSSQLSVLVSPQPGRALGHKAARLRAGELVAFAWPSYPRAGERFGAAETVRIRTTIGKQGQVQDIKLVSGSNALFSAATNAIRQWRYRPTLLNEQPVQAQQEVTIEFRPQEYVSRVRAPFPAAN